ncbi:MAG: TonB-dependent receptor plug domain-containing protein [Prevotella sp.]|nr:TonB-dependent receptor plug domain-containing protein [Prevotella sp.]
MGAPQRHEDVKVTSPGPSRRLRGVSGVKGSSEPLIVVDGDVWEINTKNFDFSSVNKEEYAKLLKLDPKYIESINVLKDAAATDIWGSQGSNGVIEIKTKIGPRGARAPEQFVYRQFPYMFKISH